VFITTNDFRFDNVVLNGYTFNTVTAKPDRQTPFTTKQEEGTNAA